MTGAVRTFELKDVLVFETHPAVRAGLVRRLESEEGLVVIQSFSDVDKFVEAIERLTPAVAVVGMFGPFGSKAANRAAEVGSDTKVVAVVPYVVPDEVADLDPSVVIVEDGPRGHHLADLVMGRSQEPHIS